MKTEEIAEKARKYGEQYRFSVWKYFAEVSFAKGAEYGYEACNAEWQEKVRWKNINEEKPKNGKLYIVKSNYSTHPIIARCTGPLMPKWILFENSEGRMKINGVTHYREIIE